MASRLESLAEEIVKIHRPRNNRYDKCRIKLQQAARDRFDTELSDTQAIELISETVIPKRIEVELNQAYF